MQQSLEGLSQEVRRCVEACSECDRSCVRTITHCLQKGGEHAALSHIALLLDCSGLCRLSVDFMLGQSEFTQRLCELCAEVCERCAEDCERMGDDEMMKACAASCRRCAEACRAMAQAA